MTLDEAIAALRAGLVVGVPTDTVYGLAAHPDHPQAVDTLFTLKGRPDTKPIAVLVANTDQARQVGKLPDPLPRFVSEHWPGALTVVVVAARDLPDHVGDDEASTVALRVPDHAVLLKLLESTGPLAVTSANLSGDEAVLDHAEAASVFGAAVAGYVPGRSPGGTSSTVVDLTVEPPEILREGPIRLGG